MSIVAVVKLAAASDSKRLSGEEYKELLKIGLLQVSGKDNLNAAVELLLPGTRVGIKTSCLARRFNSTPVPLVEALADTLKEARRDENDIFVWERTARELEAAGFSLNIAPGNFKCLGTDTAGFGYSDQFYTSGPVNSLISRILTETVDSNVNMPILKDHSIAGLSAGLKNMYGAINNPNKFHADNCSPYAAHVANLEPIRQKNRLAVIDAVQVQYQGGPGFDSRYLDFYRGLIISADPVAADTVALLILEHLREKHGLPSLDKAGRPVRYLKIAQDLGLGTADLNRIELKVFTIDSLGDKTEGQLY